MNAWKARVLGRRTLLRSPYFTIVQERVRLGGRTFDYEYRPHGPVVHVLAVTPGGDAVLVRQYRHPVRRTLLELPAGKAEPGESPLAAAKRELREETGHAARRWVHLGGWPSSPASSSMVVHYYLALGARRAGPQRLDDLEFLRVERAPWRGLLARLRRSSATTANTLFGLCLAEPLRDRSA